MPILVEWDSPAKTAIRFQFKNMWSWEEYDHAIEGSRLLINSMQYDIDLMYDFTQSAPIPADALIRFSESLKNAPPVPNRGRRVAIVNRVHWVKLAELYNQFYVKETGMPAIHIVESVELARQLFAKSTEAPASAGKS